MAEMLEKMVQDIIDKRMAELYPHSMIPAATHARITGRKEIGSYTYNDMTIDQCDECGPLANKKIIGKWYEYTLKILTRHGAPDDRFPEVPQVKSKIQIEIGGTAAVVMLYGELRPFIVGEAK